MNVIGLDVGRNGVKAYNGAEMIWFPSIVGEGYERKLKTDYPNGYDITVDGERYFIGELARNESDNWRYMMTESKIHFDTLILTLTAICHARGSKDVVIVTGLPVNQHDPEHKKEMRDLLIGPRAGIWDVTFNGERHVIRIQDVKVAVEGGAAFWSDPRDGLIRLIDAGSKTVNYLTIRDRRYNNRDSDTLRFGWNTNNSDIPKEFAAKVAGGVSKKNWSSDDTVLVSGGRAAELASLLIPYFPKATALPHPMFANAIGYYRAGKAAL